MKLRYMIIGAGGVGGPVGAYLSKSGADTTLIARGKHLAVLQEHGLTLVSGENERESIPVKAIDMDVPGLVHTARQAMGAGGT